MDCASYYNRPPIVSAYFMEHFAIFFVGLCILLQYFTSLAHIQCLFYIWKVVLSISKGFHLLLDIKLKSLKLFENASIPFEDNLVIH